MNLRHKAKLPNTPYGHKINKPQLAKNSHKQSDSKKKKKPRLKRGLAIFGGILVAIMSIGYVGALVDRSNLEKTNTPIQIFDTEANIKLDYTTNTYKIYAKVSGISSFAKATVSGKTTSIIDYTKNTGAIAHELKDIKEGDSEITISINDGKRGASKIVKLYRQTKSTYDQQVAEKNRIEKAKREDKERTEKTKREEKERAEKAKKEAEEKRKQEEEAAAAARTRQRQTQTLPNRPTVTQTPAPPAQQQHTVYFNNCREARAAGYSHIRRGEPGYGSHLDRDDDGIACDKHR